MMCYRDTTYCNAACATDACPRKLTPAVTEAARKWWGGDGAPIAVGDRSEGCAEYVAMQAEPPK